MFIVSLDYAEQNVIFSDGSYVPFDRFVGEIRVGRLVTQTEEGRFICLETEIVCPSCSN